MFIVNVTYKVSLDIADQYLEKHIDFVKEQFAKGNFILSGKKNPRDGGLVFSNIENKSELEAILELDPFKIHDIANFDIIEFLPTRALEGYENFLQK